MKIKNSRLYPYPVLSELLDDYVDNTFNVEVLISQEIDIFKFNVNVKLTNSDMLKIIETNKAKLYMHVECSTTKYRGSFVIDQFNNYDITIDDSYLNGPVEVIFLIIASETMEQYTSSTLNGYYSRQTYDISKFSTLGYTVSQIFTVNKMLDSNGEIPSIFLISQSSENLMKIELNSNKIIILLPEKSYNAYEKMKNIHVKIKQLFINVSTLVYVFDELKRGTADYESYIWYIVIEKELIKLGKGFEEGINSEKFINTSSIEIAQLIMKNIVIDGFNELTVLQEKYIDQEG